MTKYKRRGTVEENGSSSGLAVNWYYPGKCCKNEIRNRCQTRPRSVPTTS